MEVTKQAKAKLHKQQTQNVVKEIGVKEEQNTWMMWWKGIEKIELRRKVHKGMLKFYEMRWNSQGLARVHDFHFK